MDGVLEYLRRRRDYLRGALPFYETRKITTHENYKDTTEQTVLDMHRDLHEVEDLLAKHEARNA